MEIPLDVDPQKIIRGSDEPAPTAQKHIGGTKVMSEEEFQQLVFTEVTDAVQYVQEDGLMIQRWTATDYYKGRLPDIDLEDVDEDRSKAVMTEVRDTMLGLMPDLLRIFFSSEGLVKYKPVADPDPQKFAQNQLAAKTATHFVQDVVLGSDNPDSFRTFHDVFQDAGVRKTGVVKYRWEKTKKPAYTSYTGLDEQTLLGLLTADEGLEVVSKRAYPGAAGILYDVTLKKTKDHGRVRLKGIPCEQIFVSRRGRSMYDTPLFGYSEDWMLGDFVAAGFDPDELEDCDQDIMDSENPESQARQPTPGIFKREGDDPPQDPSQRQIKHTEGWLLADYDNDGIPELRHFIAAGTRFKVLLNEPADDIQCADFCMFPEAFVFFGDSMADMTMDIQRVKSRVLRDILDSLAQSVEPQRAVVEGQVNLDDVLNGDTSKVIRQRAPGMIQDLIVPFVGKEGLPILELMTQVREQRTGQSEASQGLDADVLQSSTQSAVHATLTKAQSRTEMIVRIFAETGMRKLFTGILKLLVKHQTEVRHVVLRGKVTAIDPSQWSPEMDVQPTVALGRGMPQEQIAFLMQVLAKQEQILTMLGPSNPLVTLEQYFYSLSRILELGGFQNVESFFTDPASLSPQQQQQFVQAMQQAAQQKAGGGQGGGQNPQVQMAKIQADTQNAAADRQLKMAELQARLRLEAQDKAMQFHLKSLELMTQRGTALDTTHIDAAVKMAVERLNAATEIKLENMRQDGALQIEDKRQESARIERASRGNDQ